MAPIIQSYILIILFIQYVLVSYSAETVFTIYRKSKPEHQFDYLKTHTFIPYDSIKGMLKKN